MKIARGNGCRGPWRGGSCVSRGFLTTGSEPEALFIFGKSERIFYRIYVLAKNICSGEYIPGPGIFVLVTGKRFLILVTNIDIIKVTNMKGGDKMYTKQVLMAMKKEELRNVLREKNQKVSGSKEDLIERILSNQEKVTDESVVISDKESTGKELPEKVTVSEIERLLEENRLLKEQLGRRNAGKPAIGVTKKVSLTLTVEDWQNIDRESKKFGSKSAYLRYIVEVYLHGTR